MKKYLIGFLFIILCLSKSNADSTSLKNRFILKNSQNTGLSIIGWQTIGVGGGVKILNAGWAIGEIITYERFIKNRLSLEINVAQQITSVQRGSKFKMSYVTVPIYVNYYPKFFRNLGSFNICFVNGFQKRTFDNDSFNFKKFQSNINLGLSLYLIPKKFFMKPNKHWIFELGFGLPVYNFTNYPALPSGYTGLRYNLNRK